MSVATQNVSAGVCLRPNQSCIWGQASQGLLLRVTVNYSMCLLYISYIIIIARFSRLEARCVCKQAAAKAAKILPLVRLARSKQDPINRGHGAQYQYRPPPAGAMFL